jgi:predicted MFS family arabinose efflux permease
MPTGIGTIGAARKHRPVSSSTTLTPFANRRFRFQWSADLCTAWALEMETLILGWYVLVESGSVVLLTTFGALMYVGTLLSPMVGMLGDRWGLRRVLASMRLVYAAMAVLVLLLAANDGLKPETVLAIAFTVGLLKPSDIGMRTALVSATVQPAQLVAAMGISRTTQDSARIGGALAGTGFVAVYGMVPVYIAIVAIYLMAVALTWAAGQNADPGHASQARNTSAPAVSAWHELKEGLLHVWRTPELRSALSLAALVNLTAFPLTGGLMPYIARDVFAIGQQGLGWLVASFASGALIGSLGISTWGRHLPPARTMLITCLVWHLCLLGFAWSGELVTAMACLLGAGLAQSLSMVCLSIVLMRCSEERFRGRVMGVRMLAIYTLPIGLLLAGVLISALGFRGMASSYVVVGLLMTGVILWLWRDRLVPRTAKANAR